MIPLSKQQPAAKRSQRYWSFCDYAREYQFQRLFKPGRKLGSGYIVAVTDQYMTHIGKITLSGSFRAQFNDHKFWVKKFLKKKGFLSSGAEKSLMWEGTPSNWVLHMKPTIPWSKELYDEWCHFQNLLPFAMNKGSVSLVVRYVDLNVRTIYKERVPDKFIHRKLHCLNSPCDWLTAKGGRFMKGKDKFMGNNSVLGEILVEGHESVVGFTLNYFVVDAKMINELKIGTCYATEMLARVGRLTMVSDLIRGKLKLSGLVLFHENSFERVWSAVFAAVEVGNVKSLKEAVSLSTKNNLHIRGERGITALGLSVMKNRLDLVKVLVEACVDVDQPSWADETALCLALQFGASSEVIQELIHAGAATTGRDSTGNSIRDQLNARKIFVA